MTMAAPTLLLLSLLTNESHGFVQPNKHHRLEIRTRDAVVGNVGGSRSSSSSSSKRSSSPLTFVQWMVQSHESTTTASSSSSALKEKGSDADGSAVSNNFFFFNQQQRQRQRQPVDDNSKDLSSTESSSPSSSFSPSRISMMALYAAKDTLDPLMDQVDNVTNGWALGYADLSPENETTPIGISFLATNIAYASVGFLLSIQGDLVLGTLLEIVSIASFAYHYTQLMDPSGRLPKGTVKTAILIDYIFALSSIGLGLVYLAIDQQFPSIDAIISGALAIACLGACWTWEYGLPYIILHGLWHLFSAYTGYLIGTEHITHHLG